jgi:hypothetical protein
MIGHSASKVEPSPSPPVSEDDDDEFVEAVEEEQMDQWEDEQAPWMRSR